jgi:hypothetical protein
MLLPERVFLIVVQTEGGRDPDRMPLLIRNDGDRSVSPVFSSMQHATTFLARAQELGHHVKLDYIFPADGRRLIEDFPGHSFRLDPAPELFFEKIGPPPPGEGRAGGS